MGRRGRRRVFSEDTFHLSVRVPESLYYRLEAEAGRRGVKLSVLVREILSEWCLESK